MLELMVIDGFEARVLMVMADAFCVPLITGVLLTTRIRYAVPDVVEAGIMAVMVPDATDANDPMFTGVVNAPVELLSWAVKIFPAVYVPVIVYGTLMDAPAQSVVEIVPVAMVCACTTFTIAMMLRKTVIIFFITFFSMLMI
jgi:hypothetical protein